VTLEVRVAQAGPIPLAASFECAPGEMLAIVGPSGSGKTTLLRSIAGLYSPQRGEVRVAGHAWLDTATRVNLPAHRRNVGLVFQSYALFPHMTAIENVACALQAHPAAQRRARAAEVLAAVRLGGLEDRFPSQLSGGQQQRVAVARAIARNPDVLLLDEPFSAVDRSTRRRLYVEIAELRQSLRMPTVLVTHDLEEAVMLADRLAVIHHGETLQTGTPREVMTRPASAAVARLTDLRNIFEGRVADSEGAPGKVLIDWAGLRLEATTPAPLAAGSRVTWVIPDGFIVLHRRDRPSRGEHENPVEGMIDSVVVVGETALVTMHTARERFPLHFSVPAHVARRNALAKGATATVSLLAEGIHVMPRE
jgi:molybdate transport system ATP-binding protein